MVLCLKVPMFCFLTLLLNNPVDTDRWILIKHIYRVGRAANYQSNTGIENCEIKPLNKPITAIMSQHT